MSIHREKRSKAAKAVIFDYEKFSAIGPRQKKLRAVGDLPLRSTGREEPAAVGERQFMCSMEERRCESNAKRLPAFKIIQENLYTLDI